MTPHPSIFQDKSVTWFQTWPIQCDLFVGFILHLDGTKYKLLACARAEARVGVRIRDIHREIQGERERDEERDIKRETCVTRHICLWHDDLCVCVSVVCFDVCN